MPAVTYDKIATTTLSSAAASVTFSSISGSYTDFILIADHQNSATTNITVQVGNGSIDTGSNYSITYLLGDGSSASSGRSSNASNMDFAYVAANSQSNLILHFQNYANTTTYKTILVRNNGAAQGVTARVGLWRSTSAINTVKLNSLTGNFNSGSTFNLYGIKAA